MKRVFKIGCFVLLAGVVICVIAFAVMGWDVNGLNGLNGKWDKMEKTYTASADIDAIIIDDYNTSVCVENSQDDSVHVTYYENKKEYYTITEQPSLKFVKQDDSKWYERIFSVNFTDDKLTIYLPQGYDGDIHITTGNGGIAAQGISAGDIYVGTSNNEVHLIGTRAKGNIDVDSSNGRLKMDDVGAGESITANTSNGGIYCKGAAAQNMVFKTSNGNVEAQGLLAQGDVRLETSNNSIKLDGIEFGGVCTLKSSNGSITGVMPGRAVDYAISAQTSNGHSNLPETLMGGAKTLRVQTSNGDIDIVFDDDQETAQ